MNKDRPDVNQNVPELIGTPVPITPHVRGLYESGKTILIESVHAGRDFCKIMINVTTAAIAVYLTMLKFTLPKDYTLSFLKAIAAAIPALLYLISVVIFVVGFMPVSCQFSLDVVEEIERARRQSILRRRKVIRVALAFFILGTFTAIGVIVLYISVK